MNVRKILEESRQGPNSYCFPKFQIRSQVNAEIQKFFLQADSEADQKDRVDRNVGKVSI